MSHHIQKSDIDEKMSVLSLALCACAHAGFKQQPRQKKYLIKIMLDLISAFLNHFFLCLWPIFVLLQEWLEEMWAGGEG